MGSGGGGAWKVAYADFVTAMMAFFMVMWLTGQKPEVKASIAGYFRDPLASETGVGGDGGKFNAEAPYANEQEKRSNKPPKKPGFAASGEKRLLAPPPQTSSEDTTWTSVAFDVDGAEVSVDEVARLKEGIEPFLGKPNRVEVRAHCLRKPLPKGSPYADHWELCYARATAVMRELEKLGVDPRRFRLSQAEGNEDATATLSDKSLAVSSRVDVLLLREQADLTAGD